MLLVNKACELVSMATKAGHEVRVMMTENGTRFVGPTTFEALTHHPVLTNTFTDALAHIELNAVDLAWDILVRFTESQKLPSAFINDWVSVADEEAKHFALLNNRLKDLGSHYGALPAHDGLWEIAIATANNFSARLAVVPLVLEARGLDVTQIMI